MISRVLTSLVYLLMVTVWRAWGRACWAVKVDVLMKREKQRFADQRYRQVFARHSTT
jgi:type IV secretory pathway TrbD component